MVILKTLSAQVFFAALTAVVFFSGTLQPTVEPLPEVVRLMGEGEPGRRLDLVFLAEGFQAEELPQFLQESNRILGYLFHQEPFSAYRDFFSVYAVETVSAESGVDHPARGEFRDTFFNASFDSWGLARGLTIPPNNFDPDPADGFGKARAMLETLVPGYDVIIVVANDREDGGWGDWRGVVTSISTSSTDIVTHELGHALAHLGDEYETPFPDDPEPVREEANTTQETRRDHIKWRAWIDPDTPIPTPSSVPGNTVGLFEGARYNSTGWYRPQKTCRMRASWTPFCVVCRAALVKAVHERVDPIEAMLPEIPEIRATGPEPLDFSLSLLEPNAHELDVQWFLNGSLVRSSERLQERLDPVAIGNSLFNLRVEVTDPTPWVRNDPDGLLHHFREWAIQVSGIEPAMSPSLYFPAVLSGKNFTGLAVSNDDSSSTELTLTGYGSDGQAIEPEESRLSLSPHGQIARLASEWFPTAADLARKTPASRPAAGAPASNPRLGRRIRATQFDEPGRGTGDFRRLRRAILLRRSSQHSRFGAAGLITDW